MPLFHESGFFAASLAPMRVALLSATHPKKTRPRSIAIRVNSTRIGRMSANSTSAWPRDFARPRRRDSFMWGRSIGFIAVTLSW